MPKRPMASGGTTTNNNNGKEQNLTNRLEISPDACDGSSPVRAAASSPPEGSTIADMQTQITQSPKRPDAQEGKQEVQTSKIRISKKRNRSEDKSREGVSRKERKVLVHSDCLINSPPDT